MKYLVSLLLLLLLPGAVFAQATLTGIVRDEASGAVLPGVTVEAASPALDSVRSAITDATGQYTIVNLPPGTYSLRFTLSGFTTTRRDNIELAGTQTVTTPVELRRESTSPLPSLTRPRVVCGMTVLPAPDVDPRIRHEVPKGGPTPLIRRIAPSVCGSNQMTPGTALPRPR